MDQTARRLRPHALASDGEAGRVGLLFHSLPTAPMRRATQAEDAVDNEQETAGAGVSRGQNQLHIIPEDWHVAGAAIAPITERVDPASDSTQLVIVTPDAEAAAGIAERV